MQRLPRKIIKEIRTRHNINSLFEIKWIKVSKSKVNFYLDVLDYFFDNSCLHFRALIIPNKSLLDHKKYQQTHDDWYYKMYFDMLKIIIDSDFQYHIYLDYKDTLGASKVKKLHNVLANAHYDFSKDILERIQLVRSHEAELLQLADMLIGAIAYANRGLSGNQGKEILVARMKERSGFSLLKSTLPKESKVNLFNWSASACRRD